MNSFLFALNATSPIVIMLGLGYLLKSRRLINADFTRIGNNLVFRVFLPAMLFLNIYKIEGIGKINFGFIGYAVGAVIVIALLALPVIVIFTKENKKRGALYQGIFRSNYALVGVPLAEALFGQSGVAVASLLSAFAIPVFNVLAVIILSVFSDNGKGRASLKKIIVGIIKNPLIHAVLLGIIALTLREVLISADVSWRLSDIAPLYKVLGYLSSVATPLALIILGAQFEFSAVRELRREIIFGVLARCFIVPLLGIGAAVLLFRNSFGGASFAALAALFSTPVAVSSVPMAQEMKSDVRLAGQLVVWSTVFSTLTIFFSAVILRSLGIF